jgi:hypothetical protein
VGAAKGGSRVQRLVERRPERVDVEASVQRLTAGPHLLGDMYAGVPTGTPVRVRRVVSALGAAARPKSSTTARPPPVRA